MHTAGIMCGGVGRIDVEGAHPDGSVIAKSGGLGQRDEVG